MYNKKFGDEFGLLTYNGREKIGRMLLRELFNYPYNLSWCCSCETFTEFVLNNLPQSNVLDSCIKGIKGYE